MQKDKFNKVAQHNISIQIIATFLYKSSDKLKEEIKREILFTIFSKRMKYLGIKL